MRLYAADTEVFEEDYIAVFKEVKTGEFYVYHNDPAGITDKLSEPDSIFAFYNGKGYDRFVLSAMIRSGVPEDVKKVNDWIISGNKGWDYPERDLVKFNFALIDLMDDSQPMSLKTIEGHLGLSIVESKVDFTHKGKLNQEELEEVITYCKYDVDMVERLLRLRKNYLQTKIDLGAKAGVSPIRALGLTNAGLTALFLKAERKEFDDERNYEYPENLLWEYIPEEVKAFFNRLHDASITDDEVFKGKLEIKIGECDVTVGFGGVHGAIKKYIEEEQGRRSIRNIDVSSYYPHLMVLDGYTSRAIPNPKIYEDVLKTRILAKKQGDKATADALKLVVNTTYGATLAPYSALYDPKMARSVCITGQLRLIELAKHLCSECHSLRLIQLNTDGIMISLEDEDVSQYKEICREWQERTGFTLEQDIVLKIVQKDVSNYVAIELPENISYENGVKNPDIKIKGGYLVRGTHTNGAFSINNNMSIVSKAIIDFFTKDIMPEETINNCSNILDFQIISHASSKYSEAYHEVDGALIKIQKTNRVYTTTDERYGKLYKKHKTAGNIVKQQSLPEHCIIDNANELSISDIDKQFYIDLAKKRIKEFGGDI